MPNEINECIVYELAKAAGFTILETTALDHSVDADSKHESKLAVADPASKFFFDAPRIPPVCITDNKSFVESLAQSPGMFQVPQEAGQFLKQLLSAAGSVRYNC